MSDDLNTEIKIGADATGVEAGVGRAKRSLSDLGMAAKKAGKDAGDGVGSIGAGSDKAARDVERNTKSMVGMLQRVLAEQKAGVKGSREYYEALADTRGITRSAIKPILDQIDAAKAKTLAAKSATESWQASLTKIGPAIAAAFSGAAIGATIGKVIAIQREFDSLNSSLKTVTGSSAAAEMELAWLKQFAKETPFGLSQATQGFIKMKALGLDPTRASLTSFGNTASAMGKDLNQMIEAVADASTGEFERLKEFGIKAKKEGDNVSLTFQGVTTTIRNSAAEITKYLERIGNVEFGGAMSERAKTLDGAISGLSDTWDELFRSIGSSNAGTLIYDSVVLATKAIEDATTILRAFNGATDDAAAKSGAFASVQEGLAITFETVAVMAAQLTYVLSAVGREIGGWAAQLNALEIGPAELANPAAAAGKAIAALAKGRGEVVAQIHRDMKSDAETARKAVDATTARILNARKELQQYSSYSTRNASAATDPRRVDLGRPAPATPGPVVGGSSKGGRAELSEYDKLIQKLGQEIPKAAAEAEAAQQGYNKAQTEFLALAGSDVWAKFTNSQRANVAALFENKIASEQAGDAAKTLAKASTDAAQAREKYLASLDTGLDKIRADIAAQQEATARMGLTKDAIAELDGAKLEMLATDVELQAIKALDRNLDQQTYDSLKRQAEAYRELAAAKKDGAAKEIALDLEKANEDAAKDAAREWKRAADDINNSLTDALLRGFESGKGFAKNFVDTIKNLFSTLVLRPIISAIVSPVAGALTGALGLSGTASAGTSAISSIGSGASLLSGLGAFGGGLSGGFGGLMGSLGLSATGTTLGGALSAGSIALGSGNILGGLGTFAGALGPLALGIGALTAILGKTKGEIRTGGQFGVAFDGSVTNQRRGETYTMVGQQFDRDFTNGQNRALTDGQAYRLEGDPVAQESAIRDAVSGTAKGINSFLEALGSKARLSGFSAGLETSGKGRGGVFAGGLFEDGTAFGESGKGDNYAQTLYEKFSTNSPDFKQALADFTLDLKQSTIQALQSVTDIPESIKKTLKDVDAEGLSEEAANALLESINAQIVGVKQLKDAFDAMGMDSLAALSFDAAAGLAEVSGGFDKLLGNLNTYYSNFFSPEEQRANIERQLKEAFGKLKLALPDINASDARDQFRALVTAAERDMSEEGRKTYATLLSLSGAFAGITTAAEGATAALKDQQDAIYSLFQRALGLDRDSLNEQASALQDTISGISDAVDMLRSNARDLYGTVDSTQQMLAAQGMVYIEQALAGVRAGGSVTDYTGLSDAIGAARGGIDSGRYTSQFERERDTLVLAGQLSQLAESGELQLSFEERQLKAINEQLDYLNKLDKRAEELVNGTAALTGTVQSYFDQLLAFLNPEKPEPAATPSASEGGFSSGPSGGSTPAYDRSADIRATFDGTDLTNAASVRDAALTASIKGVTQADFATAYKVSQEDVEKLFASFGVAKFDIGTNYVPRDMLAMIHEGEAVVPKAYNPAANPGMNGGNSARLEALVERLTEEVAQLKAATNTTAGNTALMPQMARQIDTYTNGGTFSRQKALA